MYFIILTNKIFKIKINLRQNIKISNNWFLLKKNFKNFFRINFQKVLNGCLKDLIRILYFSGLLFNKFSN